MATTQVITLPTELNPNLVINGINLPMEFYQHINIDPNNVPGVGFTEFTEYKSKSESPLLASVCIAKTCNNTTWRRAWHYKAVISVMRKVNGKHVQIWCGSVTFTCKSGTCIVTESDLFAHPSKMVVTGVDLIHYPADLTATAAKQMFVQMAVMQFAWFAGQMLYGGVQVVAINKYTRGIQWAHLTPCPTPITLGAALKQGLLTPNMPFNVILPGTKTPLRYIFFKQTAKNLVLHQTFVNRTYYQPKTASALNWLVQLS